MKAIWNETIIAESNDTKVIEGNHYFPPQSIKSEYFKESTTHSTCPWKGQANYYTLEIKGETNTDAAWYYPSTKDMAKPIEGYIAFWKGVDVTE